MNQDLTTASHLFNQVLDAYQTGQLSEAIRFWTEAKTIYLRFYMEMEVANCDVNIGVVLLNLGQPQEAIEHLQRAKATCLRLGLNERATDCDSYIAIALRDPGQRDARHEPEWLEPHKRGVACLQGFEYGLAKRCFEQSLKLATDKGHKMGIAASQQALGQIYGSAHEFKLARDLLDKALTTFRAIRLSKGLVGTLLEIAKVDIFEGLPENVWGPKLNEAKQIAVSARLPTEPLEQWIEIGRGQTVYMHVDSEEVRRQLGL